MARRQSGFDRQVRVIPLRAPRAHSRKDQPGRFPLPVSGTFAGNRGMTWPGYQY